MDTLNSMFINRHGGQFIENEFKAESTNIWGQLQAHSFPFILNDILTKLSLGILEQNEDEKERLLLA